MCNADSQDSVGLRGSDKYAILSSLIAGGQKERLRNNPVIKVPFA